jgi:hypothetical protein
MRGLIMTDAGEGNQMRKRPIFIKILALSVFIAPLLCIALLADMNREFYHLLTNDLRLQLFVFVGASWLSAYGIWRARPWGIKLFLFYIAAIVVADLGDFIAHPLGRNAWHLIDILVGAIGVAIILRKKNRDVFFNRALRWWERATRFDTNIKSDFISNQNKSVGEITSLSASGCFSSLSQSLEIGAVVKIDFHINGKNELLDARVVRLNTKPAGVAFEFIHKNKMAEFLFGMRLKKQKHTQLKAAA